MLANFPLEAFRIDVPSFIRVRSVPFVCGILICAMALIRTFYFYSGGEESFIRVIPDDAFYYIQLARHRVKDGFWTFDGTAPATGFHLLYGYVLFGLYSFFIKLKLKTLFLIVGLLASMSLGLSAFFVCRTVQKVFGSQLIPIAIASFFSPLIIIQSTAMMESWLVLLLASLTVFTSINEEKLSIPKGIGLFCLGLLGSLARSDYGMLPGMLFCAALISRLVFKKSPPLGRYALLLAGAIMGVAIILLHTYLVSGHLVQSSAQVKVYWSSKLGHDLFAPLNFIFSLAFPFFDKVKKWGFGEGFILLIVLSFMLFLIRYFLILRKESQTTLEFSHFLGLGSTLTLFGYIFFYKYDSDCLQNWYSANFLIPLSIFFSALFHALLKNKIFWPAHTVCMIYFSFGLFGLFSMPWAYHTNLMKAGLLLKKNAVESPIASWNTGILSYFSEKPIVNIDGLANDEVVPFIKSNTLLDYIKNKHIQSIVDYDGMLQLKWLVIRGGYNDPKMDKCLLPQEKYFDVRLYKIKPNCL